jgi:DNA processing protein
VIPLNEFEALCLLTTIPQLGSIKIRLLITQFGSALEAVQADANSIVELPGFGPKFAKSWDKVRNSNQWRETLHLCHQEGIEVIPYTSPKYPKRLLEIVDHPILLYVKGAILKEDQRSLAVIGTRQATIYGIEMARKISAELTRYGFTIVSGLARGIDAAAHEGALLGGRTLGVIGSGLANIYPREHVILGNQVIERGALISEFPPLTPPDRQTFPQRNRIVSGMTQGTILIEAPEKSGAMITVQKAMSQDRPIFALPGRADISSFRGNHYLIKNGYARLIENAEDIANQFDQLLPVDRSPAMAGLQIALEPEERELLNMLPLEEQSVEQIHSLSKLPIAKLNVLLMSLVLKKGIKVFPGRVYKKVGSILYG